MKKLGIEYVCTANGGRSPMAEAIGKDQVAKLGLDDRMVIYSSGSHYEDLQTGNMPFSYLMSSLELGLERNIYSREEREHAKKLFENKEGTAQAFEYDISTRTAVQTLASIAEDILGREEETIRDIALEEIGLRYSGSPKQFRPREDVQLVLPMSENNATRVRELSNSSQSIMLLSEYSGIKENIPDPFGKGLEIFRETRDHIKNLVMKSIARAQEEYLLGERK